jgi:putative hydrolase of the HAD superfamily
MGNEYAEKREQAVTPFPGAVDALVALKDLGIRMAMVTNGNSETQRAKINRWDLEQYFEYILIEGEFGTGKPDPKVYRNAMGTLDAQPSETWMIGDNLEWEVVAPQRLGITGIWNDWRGKGLPLGSSAKPDRIITSLQELLQIPMD